MAPKVDVLQAVSRIGLVWVNFAVKAFKMAWHIMLTSPEEEDSDRLAPSRTHLPPKKSTSLEEDSWEVVQCENCQGRFFDDGNESEYGRFFCETAAITN